MLALFTPVCFSLNVPRAGVLRDERSAAAAAAAVHEVGSVSPMERKPRHLL